MRSPATGTDPLTPAGALTALATVALAVCLYALCALGAAGGFFGPDEAQARAAEAVATAGGQKVVAFEDVTIGAGESWDNVVVVGGDVMVDGTVRNVVVVVGGDLTVGSNARLGTGVGPDAAAVVAVLGEVTIEAGARIDGRVVDVAGSVSGALDSVFSDPVFRPWSFGSVVGWIASTVGMAIVAIIIVAIAPRQVAVVRDRVRGHFFSSLGWGALGAVIGIPLVSVFLIVTIVGLLLLVPWLAVVVPIVSLFGFVAVGAALGRMILGVREDRRGALMAAAVLGVFIVNVLRWIPVGGFVIAVLLWFVGFGATWVAIWVWRRDKRRDARERLARERAAAAAGAPPPGGAAPPPTVDGAPSAPGRPPEGGPPPPADGPPSG